MFFIARCDKNLMKTREDDDLDRDSFVTDSINLVLFIIWSHGFWIHHETNGPNFKVRDLVRTISVPQCTVC